MRAAAKSDEITFRARDYQVTATRHLVKNPFSGLFMDPGTGKTPVVLSAFYILRTRKLTRRMLVVAPLNPVYNVWPLEVEKWNFPFRVSVLHGPKKAERLRDDADLYVINYEGLPWLASQRGWEFDWLVLDESSRVRNTRTVRFRTLKTILKKFKRRTVLTGTPTPRGYINLFGQIYCLDQGDTLGRYVTHYRREHFYQTGYGGYTWELQRGHDEIINEKIKPLIVRFGEEVLDLPRKMTVPVYLSMDDRTRETYERFEQELVMEIEEGTVTAVNAAVLTQKLRQVANGGVYDDDGAVRHLHDEKAQAVREIVEELGGKPVLVGYEFRHDEERLRRVLEKHGHRPATVSGKTSQRDRNRIFREFNAGEHEVLLAQMSTTALGLNLQESCSHVVVHSLPWDLETYIQFIRRVYRTGQKNRTWVHELVTRDTVDEVVSKTLRIKSATQSKLLSALRTHVRKRRKR